MVLDSEVDNFEVRTVLEEENEKRTKYKVITGTH